MNAAELARRGLSEETIKKYGDPFDYTHPVNQQTGQRRHLRSVWGFGGWYSNAIDVALRRDDAEAFIEIMRAAELGATTHTFDDLTMKQYCEKRGAAKCSKALKMLEDQAEIRRMSEEKRLSR